MEKAPRKKAKTPLRGRTLLLLALGCALLAGGVLLYLRTRPAALPPLEEKETVMLLKRPEEEIFSIAVTPREGTAYPLVREGDRFILAGRPEEALRQTILDEMLLTLTNLPAESVLLEDMQAQQSVTPSDFGLEPPLVRVAVTYVDGEKEELLIGDRAPDDEKPQRYCMLKGDQRLFTVLWADSEALLHDVDSLRDFEQPSLDASLLDRIDVTGDIKWSLYYTPSGWYMDAPFSYPLSPGRVEALLSHVENMGFASCLGEAEKMNLEPYGLDAPALRITLTQAASVISGETVQGESVTLPVDQKTYTLLIGAETGKSGVYVEWNGLVFRASNFLLGFWKELNYQNYLLQTPVNFLTNNLTALTFSFGGSEKSYEVRMVESITQNNQIATDEYGRVLYDCAVKRAGEEKDMDAEAFLSWYTRLASLSADGELPKGYAPSGESRGRIELKNESVSRVIEFYPYDALHDALAVDGVALYYVQKTWLDGVADAP